MTHETNTAEVGLQIAKHECSCIQKQNVMLPVSE